MSDMDGTEFTSLVRNKFNICHDRLKIAVMYNASEEELANEVSTINENSLKLMKPVKVDDLYALISNNKNTNKENENSIHSNTQTKIIENELKKITDKKVILIAEDVAMNMFLIKKIVSNILPNVEIIEAVNGRETLEIVRNQYVDLVLMDVQMPEMDGMEATQKIRLLDLERVKNLPIIALTAGALKEEKEKALNAGMNDFLTKPIDTEHLERLLNKYLTQCPD
jgi:CheY-like chemotaxis protein